MLFFMVDKDEIEEKRKELAKILFEDPNSGCHINQGSADAEAKRRLYRPFSKVLSDVPRKIPEPVELERRICAVVKLCTNVPDAKTGEMFFSEQTANVLKHVRLGCLGDVPGLDYYYTTTSPSGKTTLWSVLFGVHLNSKGFISTSGVSLPGFAHCHAWRLVFWLSSSIAGTLKERLSGSLGSKVRRMVQS